MQKLPKGTYPKEFREEAVKLVLEERLSLREAGQQLSLSPKTLQNWVIAARKGTLKDVGSAQRPLTEIELELTRVKRELAEVKLERDFEPPRFSRRLLALSQAARADSFCWRSYAISNSAGGMLPIGSSSRR